MLILSPQTLLASSFILTQTVNTPQELRLFVPTLQEFPVSPFPKNQTAHMRRRNTGG